MSFKISNMSIDLLQKTAQIALADTTHQPATFVNVTLPFEGHGAGEQHSPEAIKKAAKVILERAIKEI